MSRFSCPECGIGVPGHVASCSRCPTAVLGVRLPDAASTARPTERGAVERAAKAIYEAGGCFRDQNGVIAWSDLEGSNDAENFRKMARAVLALPATDQAAEVGRVEFIARVLWADGQRRLKQGQSDLPRTRTDFRTAARALLDHPALATQPATGRTMGGEVEAAVLTLDVFLAAYDSEPDDAIVNADDDLLTWGHLRTILAALQNGGE